MGTWCSTCYMSLKSTGILTSLLRLGCFGTQGESSPNSSMWGPHNRLPCGSEKSSHCLARRSSLCTSSANGGFPLRTIALAPLLFLILLRYTVIQSPAGGGHHCGQCCGKTAPLPTARGLLQTRSKVGSISKPEGDAAAAPRPLHPAVPSACFLSLCIRMELVSREGGG